MVMQIKLVVIVVVVVVVVDVISIRDTNNRCLNCGMNAVIRCLSAETQEMLTSYCFQK